MIIISFIKERNINNKLMIGLSNNEQMNVDNDQDGGTWGMVGSLMSIEGMSCWGFYGWADRDLRLTTFLRLIYSDLI